MSGIARAWLPCPLLAQSLSLHIVADRRPLCKCHGHKLPNRLPCPLLAGPSGCGKTATLTTLAAAVGFDVSEWRPPPAVQWEEAQYAGIQRRQAVVLAGCRRTWATAGGGELFPRGWPANGPVQLPARLQTRCRAALPACPHPTRRNKVEEFEEIVVRTKMPHLSLRSSSSSSGMGTSAPPRAAGGGSPADGMRSSQLPRPSQAAVAEAAVAAAGRGSSQGSSQALRPGRLAPTLLPTLVVVDDLPHAAGPEQRRQIAQALGDMAAGARFPVVVVATETSGKAQQEKGLSAAAGTYQGLHKVGATMTWKQSLAAVHVMGVF